MVSNLLIAIMSYPVGGKLTMEMELHLPSISVLCSFLLVVFMVCKSVIRSKTKASAPRLPPGPWQLPLIGNIHQLFGRTLIHHTLADLSKKHGPLMHLKLGELSTVVVSSPKMAEETLKTHGIIFAERPFLLAVHIGTYGSASIGFSPYGDYWRQLRKICTMELLSSKRVQSFQPIREEEVLNLIRSISENASTPINLSEKIFALSYCTTARATFGKKSKHQEEFMVSVEELVKLAAGFSLADMYPSVKILSVVTGLRPRLEKIYRRIDQVLENIVSEHKERERRIKAGDEEANTRKDLVDVLLKVQTHGDWEFPLRDENIKAVIQNIFAAGSETSSTAVEWAISEMVRNHRVMEKAQAEVRHAFEKNGNVDEIGLGDLRYLKSVVKETLRLHPSAPLLVPRECSEQCEINGYQIPSNTKLIVNAWAIGRDPEYWTEADEFKPERFMDSPIDFKGTDFQYIPFGAGRRICPGISFAMASIELTLAQLLYHFNWELPSGLKHEELDMTEISGLTTRRKQPLYLIPVPYHSSSLIK